MQGTFKILKLWKILSMQSTSKRLVPINIRKLTIIGSFLPDLRIPRPGWRPGGWREHSCQTSSEPRSTAQPSDCVQGWSSNLEQLILLCDHTWSSPSQRREQYSNPLELKPLSDKLSIFWWIFVLDTWNTVTVAQRRESKFFLSQTPVSGSQNLHPKRFIPRMLQFIKITHVVI